MTIHIRYDSGRISASGPLHRSSLPSSLVSDAGRTPDWAPSPPGRPLGRSLRRGSETMHAARRVAAARSRFVSSSPGFMSVDWLICKDGSLLEGLVSLVSFAKEWLFGDEGFLETGNSKVKTDRSSPRQHSLIFLSPTALLLLLSGRPVSKEKVTRRAWIGSSELTSEMKSGGDLPQRVYFLVCTAWVEMMRQQYGGIQNTNRRYKYRRVKVTLYFLLAANVSISLCSFD